MNDGMAPRKFETAQGHSASFGDDPGSYARHTSLTNEKAASAAYILDHLPTNFSSLNGACLRIYDAGMGDAMLIANVVRGIGEMPINVTAKEIMAGNILQASSGIADMLMQNPLVSMNITNTRFKDASTLPREAEIKIALRSDNLVDLHRELYETLQDTLPQYWQTKTTSNGRGLVCAKPSMLSVYREGFGLERIDGVFNETPSDGYDLVIASQPWHVAQSAEKRARLIIAPLAGALAPHGRMIAIQSSGSETNPVANVYREVFDKVAYPVTLEHVAHEAMQELEGAKDAYSYDYDPVGFDYFYDDSSSENSCQDAFNCWAYDLQLSEEQRVDAIARNARARLSFEMMADRRLRFQNEALIIDRFA